MSKSDLLWLLVAGIGFVLTVVFFKLPPDKPGQHDGCK